MKRMTLLLAVLLGLTPGGSSLQAALSYWDTNSVLAGAGATPTGCWDTNLFWSADSAGGVPTGPWMPGDTAVFSAGTDATNAYTVTVATNVLAGGITFEEGLATIAAGVITMTNEFEFPIIANTNGIINSELSDGFPGSGTCGVRKTGPGKVTLGSTTSFFGGTNTVAEGTLAVTSASALGSTLAPTVVSSGASVEVTSTIPFPEPVILNGFGVGDRGALYGYVAGSGGTANLRTGGAVINSSARINHYATGGTWWNWTTTVITTNGVNNADLHLGGTGNTLRLNINQFYPDGINRRPCFDIGDGVLYKDGTVELRMENANVAREVRFNGGHIMARCGPGTNFCYRIVVPGVFVCNEGVAWLSGEYVPATIYVGPNAGQFRNGTAGPSQTWEHPIVLEAGANPTFRPYNGYSITCNGEISGQGGLSKYQDTGTLFLNGTNTYGGSTVLRGGTLTLGESGSISNSAVIDVRTGTVFNVTSNASGFTLQTAQILMGNGTVWGNVIARGTLSPGASIGALTFNNDLTVAGNLRIEVDKALFPASDAITVVGMLTNAGTGTLTVTNIGGLALAAGDSFQVFNQAVPNGDALAVVSAGSVVWANELASSGSIRVVSAPALSPATNLNALLAGPTSILVSGLGAASSFYSVYSTTNVTTPMASWTLIGNTISDAGGVIQFTDSQATQPQKYYRFGQ